MGLDAFVQAAKVPEDVHEATKELEKFVQAAKVPEETNEATEIWMNFDRPETKNVGKASYMTAFVKTSCENVAIL